MDAGSTVVLNCQAEGEPTPTIAWSQQGRPLLGNDRLSRLSNGSLRISSVQKEDTAEYECVARNLMGSALVRVALTVRGQPHATASDTREGKINLKKRSQNPAFFPQFMEDSQSGQSGVFAACPVVPELRRG